MIPYTQMSKEQQTGVDAKFLEDVNRHQELTIRLHERFARVRSILYNDNRPMTPRCFLQIDHIRNQITWYTSKFLEADPSWRMVLDLGHLIRTDESLLNEVHAEALALEKERDDRLAAAGAELPETEEKAVEHMRMLIKAFERQYPSHTRRLLHELRNG